MDDPLSPREGGLTRRALLVGAAATSLCARDGRAMGRVPVGGSVRLRVPWATGRLDPHDLHDPLAALFGPAIADPVYARQANGRVYPTLADGMPEVVDGSTLVRLRPDLRTARGLAITGRDLAWSVSRARKRGASGLLAGLDPFVQSDPDDPLVARFGAIEPKRLALLLSSPLCALLPVAFDPTAPDGTGPFRARCSSARLVLERNDNASRGPAFLDRVVVGKARDLADSLRAFEGGQDDMGWLGRGFHRDRPKSRSFDYRHAGWVVLVCGSRAGRFAAPGMAEKLARWIGAGRLHVGLRGGVGSGGQGWDGGPATLLYDAGSAHLVAIAEAVAAKLSSPGHEVTPRGLSRARLRSARKADKLALALDVVRDPGAVPSGRLIAMATADRAALGQKVGRQALVGQVKAPGLRLGVLGRIDVQGGVVRRLLLAANASGRGIDWGASYSH